MAPSPIIIDCDPGIDDALAILTALGSPEVEILAVTTVAGNAPLAATTANALRILELGGAPEIPVAAGADRPLVRPDLSRQPAAHGATGLDGADLPDPVGGPVEAHAIDVIARCALERPGQVTLVAIGPLTNVALLAAVHPQAYAALAGIVIMGGAQAAGGNITPAGEFNVWFDPEAAARALQAPVPVTMVGLDVTHQVALDRAAIEELGRIPRIGPPIEGMLRQYSERHREWYAHDHVYVHDAVAVLSIVERCLIGTEQRSVEVETGWGPSRGATLVDRWGSTDSPATVAWAVAVDADAVRAALAARLRAVAMVI